CGRRDSLRDCGRRWVGKKRRLSRFLQPMPLYYFASGAKTAIWIPSMESSFGLSPSRRNLMRQRATNCCTGVVFQSLLPSCPSRREGPTLSHPGLEADNAALIHLQRLRDFPAEDRRFFRLPGLGLEF